MIDRLRNSFALFCACIILHSQFLILNSATAQSQLPLSEGARASVVTCGPGDDFYTSFGHSAIRICDTAQGIDEVYNYGMFSFGEPNFYWHFMQGRLNYWLGRTSFLNFIDEYASKGRSVREQRLNMSALEVNNLFVALEWNYEPDNRYYRYDLLRDNCATRVRDMVAAMSGNRWRVESGEWASRSYRDYLHAALRGKLEWWTMGIDILLGLRVDHRCTPEEAMFSPLVMHDELAAMDGESGPLVSEDVLLLAENRDEVADSFPPLVVFALFFAAVALLTWKEKGGKRKVGRVLDRVLFVVAGLLGLFLLFMWFGTDHWCTKWNLNILWLSPMLLLIAIRMERSPKWALWLQEAMFAVALVWVVFCHLSVAFIPLILAISLRVGMLIQNR